MSDWNALSFEEKQAKARRADEILREAGWLFDECVATWLEAIKGSKPGDTDKREQAYQQVRAIEYLREHLGGIVNAMTLESARLDKREE